MAKFDPRDVRQPLLGESSEPPGWWLRYILFFLLMFGLVMLGSYLEVKRRMRYQATAQQLKEATPAVGADKVTQSSEEAESVSSETGDGTKSADSRLPSTPTEPTEPTSVKAASEPEPELPEQVVTLGSVDPASPYRMLVTLTTKGAAVVRIELSSPKYRDLEDRSGYLGHVCIDTDAVGEGCPVQVVGAGTPAEKCGLKPGDLITAVDGIRITGYRSLYAVLRKTKPGQSVTLTVRRGAKTLQLQAELQRRPLEVVKPENNDPLSFLLTLARVDQLDLPDLRLKYAELARLCGQARERYQLLVAGQGTPEDRSRLQKLMEEIRELATQLADDWPFGAQESLQSLQEYDRQLTAAEALVAGFDPVWDELPGVNLRLANWEIVEHDQEHVVFRRQLPQYELEVRKTFRLAKVPPDRVSDRFYPAYHLELSVAVINHSTKPHQIAYQLDGPTGLPIEGKWYASKVGRGWGAVGIRDVVVCWKGKLPQLISCLKIADDNIPIWQEQDSQRLVFLGVDAQYFSAVLIPHRKSFKEVWYRIAQPIRVGKVDPDWKRTTNTSCRLITVPVSVGPQQTFEHKYTVFAGPKAPKLLAHYGLKDIVVYGWFWWVAIPMLWLLHFFHDYLVFNYGLAIILLTLLVRFCMFPLTKRQILAAQKMQKIQPELKRIYEKYKDDPHAKLRAQQELFRKYNYHPLSGCLIVFIQLPIFIGLYRALMVDVELRQAPLISESIRWCSNLAAPDMLFDWSGFWAAIGWHWFNEGRGLFALGPYFNLLPVLTIALFIWQQRKFSPPPADEQAAMQQKVMTVMMVFLGILFYKVASGLCLYFIASSIWALIERQLIPKMVHEEEVPAKKKESSKLKSTIKEKLEAWQRLRDQLEQASQGRPQQKRAERRQSRKKQKKSK